MPIVNDIAAIIPGDGTDGDTTQDIILHCVGGGLQCISETHAAYTPLHYVLFPYGEVGWHVGIPLHNGQCRQENSPVCELPTETKLMARACHYHRPEICYEFDMQKPRILL